MFLQMNDSSTVPSRAANGVLVPLNSFIEEDNFDTDKFYPVLMDAMEYEDEYYGLANDTDTIKNTSEKPGQIQSNHRPTGMN